MTATAVPEPDAQLTYVDQQLLPDYPVANPSFVRWTMAGCAGPPRHLLAGQRPGLVGAIFTPLELEVGIAGNVSGIGTVTVEGAPPLTCETPGMIQFPNTDTGCHGLYPADSSVVLVASPDPLDSPASIQWGPGCDPDGGDPTSPRCTVTVDNLRTFAMLAFEGARCPGSHRHHPPRARHACRSRHGEGERLRLRLAVRHRSRLPVARHAQRGCRSRLALRELARGLLQQPGMHVQCRIRDERAGRLQHQFDDDDPGHHDSSHDDHRRQDGADRVRGACRAGGDDASRRSAARRPDARQRPSRPGDGRAQTAWAGRRIEDLDAETRPHGAPAQGSEGTPGGRCQLLVRLASADRTRTLTTSVLIGRR